MRESSRLTPEPAQRLALRSASVLICAELEAFLREIVQGRMDSISSAWVDMVPAERKVVAGHALEEMSSLIARLDDHGTKELKRAEQVAKTIRRLGEWLDTPGAFAGEIREVRVTHYYEPPNVFEAIGKLLAQIRDDGMPFFDWLGSRGVDQSVFRASLESLIVIRGDVAHQLRQNARPTVEELRLHQRRVASLVRLALQYVTPGGD